MPGVHKAVQVTARAGAIHRFRSKINFGSFFCSEALAAPDFRAGPSETMKKVTNLVLAFSVLFTILIMLYAGDPSSADWWTGMARFFGWACLPYGILLFFNNIYRGVFKKDLALLITTTAVAGFGFLMLADAFFIHIDAQSGLILLFLPAYQGVAALFGGLIGLGLHQRSRHAPPRH